MKKFIIERNLPGAGNMTSEELKKISKISCGVLRNMGAGYSVAAKLCNR